MVDVQPEPAVRGAFYVNLAQVNGEIEGLGKDESFCLYAPKEESVLPSEQDALLRV